MSNREVYRILNDTNGLGETGEVVVGALKGDEVTLVAPTRFAPDAAFRRKVKMGSLEAIPLQNAVLGKRGFGRMLDYRGVTAAACWAYIPSLRWGVVVKMDESEAYEMIRRVRAAIVVLLVVTLFFVALVATLIARSLSRPVVAVVELANKVAGGDLTADTDIKAHGEVGRLIQSVRRMTSDLRSLIGRIQKSSIALMSTATQIAATSKQQENLVHDYGASTNEAAAAVKEISATGQELLRTMNEVNHVAGETAALAAHGQESLSGMDHTMRLLADSTASIGSKLAVISEARRISTSSSRRSRRSPTKRTYSRSTRRSKPKKRANTASVFSSFPAKSAASPIKPPSRRSISSAWSRRCRRASRRA